MLKLGLTAAALIAAAPAIAQPGGAAPSPEIQQAAMTFGQCVGTGVMGLAATVTPEAGAASVLAGCAAQRAELERVAEASIAGSGKTDAEKAAAREQLRTRLAGAEAQIVQVIRRTRGAAAPAN